MKNVRSVVFVVIFFILAGLIGYGFEKIFVALLPSDLTGMLVRVWDIGVHSLSLNFNLCGVCGIVISFFIVNYLMKK
ncbi:MAG: hypothetical protein LBG46_06785 [Elusimicrobiota bacterium]|jgi:hypothetical protein|nr:hypothetical protein [Elusimicrobiota bacterium]